MLLIQFGWQVIHQINTLATPCLAYQMALGNSQCTNHQLLLATRKDLRGIMCTESQAQICTLRSGLGMPHLLISRKRRGEYFTEFSVLVPPAVVTQGQTLELDQVIQDSLKDRLQGFDVGAAVFIQLGAGQA
ncbi:hypothetical protein D3C81_1388430 [compost metagenome]